MEKKELKLTEDVLRQKVLGTLQPLVEWLEENSCEVGMMVCFGAREEGHEGCHTVSAMYGDMKFIKMFFSKHIGGDERLKDVVMNAHQIIAVSEMMEWIEKTFQNKDNEEDEQKDEKGGTL